MLESILIALAIVMVIEGAGPALFPNRWQRFITELAAQPTEQLRTMGGVMVTIGLVCLYFLL